MRQSEGMKFEKNFEATLKFAGSLDKAKIHKSLSFNISAIALLILISLISPLTGNILPGWRGITASYGLSIIGFIVGCFAINKLWQIERYIEVTRLESD